MNKEYCKAIIFKREQFFLGISGEKLKGHDEIDTST